MSSLLRPEILFYIFILLFSNIQTLHALSIDSNAATHLKTALISAPIISNDKTQIITLRIPNEIIVEQLYLSTAGPSLQQRWSLPHPGQNLVWLNNMVYIASGAGGLLIIDSNNHNNPLQARLSLGDPFNDISISHHHVWLAAQGGLYTVDIRDPQSPRTRAFINTPQAVTSLSSNDTYTAIAYGQEIQLFDSRLPGQLSTLSTLQLKHNIHAIALQGTQLYVAAGNAGVFRYQISAQHQLLLTGHYRTTGPAVDIQISNDVAVVATHEHGITLLDTRDKHTLHWLGSHQQTGRVLRLQLDQDGGQQLMLINDQQQLIFIDISNPRMPNVQASLQLDNFATALALHGQRVMTLVDEQLQLFDFSRKPPQISNEGLDFGQGVNYGGERRLFIRDNIAYVADWFSGIHLYDISTPQQPRLLSSYRTAGSAKGIVVRGHYAYVADDDHGLQIINIKNSRKPFKVSELRTPGLAYIPVLDGDRLYLASHHGGFQIIDISNPKNPILIGHNDTTGKTWAIRVRNNIAYIADDDSGLMMFDVSQADNIQLIGQYSPGGEAEDVILHGDIAYVAFFDKGIYIIDISDPGYPKKLGHIATPGNARGIAIEGKHLYVADWLSGIQIIDITNPAQAKIIGSYDTTGAAWGIALKNNFLYVMDWWGGFTVLDIHQAKTPRLVGKYHHRDDIHAISTRDQTAYAASGHAGLQIYDINNPLNPTWITGVDIHKKARATHVVTTKQRAYVALSTHKIAVIDISQPYNAYTIREIRTTHPIIDLQLHEAWLLVNHGDKGMTHYRINQQYADKPRKNYRLKEKINSITFVAEQFHAIAFKNGHIKIYNNAADKKPTLQFKHHSTLLRGYQDYLISYSPGKGIDILHMNGDMISHIHTNHNIIDMNIHKQHLYLIDNTRILSIIDLSNIQQPLVLSRHQLISPSKKITIGANATAYFSGNMSLTAINPILNTSWQKNIDNQNTGHYSIFLPAGMPTGAYNININNQRNNHAITIERRKYTRRMISMEDIKNALKKIHQRALLTQE